MSRTAHDTPNAWVTGWWGAKEEEIVIDGVLAVCKRLNRPPSSVVRRINKLESEGRIDLSRIIEIKKGAIE